MRYNYYYLFNLIIMKLNFKYFTCNLNLCNFNLNILMYMFNYYIYTYFIANLDFVFRVIYMKMHKIGGYFDCSAHYHRYTFSISIKTYPVQGLKKHN